MDKVTDTKIQKAIRGEFGSNTVLTIAHRLETISDGDMIVVMGDGRVLEQGSTFELLDNVHGEFSSLVDQLEPKRRASVMEAVEPRRRASLMEAVQRRLSMLSEDG